MIKLTSLPRTDAARPAARPSATTAPEAPPSATPAAGGWSNAVAGVVQPLRDGFDQARTGVTNLALGPASSSRVDGSYVGSGGVVSPGSTPVESIPGIRPEGAAPDAQLPRVYYVNGISTTIEALPNDAQRMANASGAEVVGIYNATHGAPQDLARTAGNWYGVGGSPAVDTLSSLLVGKLRTGDPVNLLCDSGGGAVTARAIRDATSQLTGSGMPSDEVERRLASVTVTTIAAAQADWPDGPTYRHYANLGDPVARFLGVASAIAHPGQGATVKEFTEGVLLNPLETDHNHGFDTYLPQLEADTDPAND